MVRVISKEEDHHNNLEIEQTLAQLLLRNYREYGEEKVAMLKKDFGIWKTYTWKESYEHIKYFCLGLLALGLKPGDKVAIMGDNDPQWYWAELAVQSAKAAIYGVYADTVVNELSFLLKHGDASFVVCSDQEQIDKVIEVKSDLSLLKKVIYWKPKGTYYFTDPDLMFWEDVENVGEEFEKSNPNLFESLIEEGEAEDIGVLCYTSGTTGQFPKAALMSHRSLITNMKNFTKCYTLTTEDIYVSSASPAWLAEQWFGITCHLLAGVQIAFPESPASLMRDLRDVGPTIIFFPTRVWENIASIIKARLNDTSRLQRFLFDRLFPIAKKTEEEKDLGRVWALLRRLADMIIFTPLRDKLGLRKCKVAFQGGAMISSEAMRFFRVIGVDLRQLYASTEGGLLAMHRGEDVDPETVGPPVDEECVMVNENREVICCGDITFSGYYKAYEACDEAVVNGWLHTGDAVLVNELGHFTYLDRVSNLVDLPEGKKFAPEFVSGRLRFNPYITDALVIGGGGKPYVMAIIVLNYDNVGDWAAKHSIPYSTYADLSQKAEVYNLIEGEIKNVNRSLPQYMCIHKFVNLHKEFDADESEMTRTRKLRRCFLEERYSSLIEAIYEGKETYNVEASVTYRDGRAGIIRTDIAIREVGRETQ